MRLNLSGCQDDVSPGDHVYLSARQLREEGSEQDTNCGKEFVTTSCSTTLLQRYNVTTSLQKRYNIVTTLQHWCYPLQHYNTSVTHNNTATPQHYNTAIIVLPTTLQHYNTTTLVLPTGGKEGKDNEGNRQPPLLSLVLPLLVVIPILERLREH